MFKKILLSILCLLNTTTTMYGMESNDLNIDGNATLNIEQQFVNVNKHDFRTYNANHYPHKAYNDPEATLGKKLTGTLVNGSWEALEATPTTIWISIVRTVTDFATTMALKRFVDWFNGMPSETPTARELAIINLTRDVAAIEAELELNKSHGKRLMADKKLAEEKQDIQEIEEINEIYRELDKKRKDLNTELRALMIHARTRVDRSQEQSIFSYPKAA